MLIQRPYLMRAFYDWIVDSECTPHVIVDATKPHVDVPQQFVENGKIVLNIGPRSVLGFSLDDNALSFNARFSGQPTQVYVPLYAIEGIYARENGAGTIFPEEEAYNDLELGLDSTEKQVKVEEKPKPSGKKPTLTVVK
ncbi:ClpXP protease specificity-enhancing factor [Psychromonas sp. B3M02]|uniref:ClpXP protease specificity-enhancing factor n=1 Tax=unclassified Psychromonas TaxID=2614957 RepID=UPI000DE9D125|nr:ClpXP protease specificity-enhancing factor [Psychromonas sp. B3M02]RBW42465.1 ClpXP protease specificity-enhancing factor [Psychromonas sp. B3M02]